MTLLASSTKNFLKEFLRPFPKPYRTTKIKMPSATVKPDKKVRILFLLIV